MGNRGSLIIDSDRLQKAASVRFRKVSKRPSCGSFRLVLCLCAVLAPVTPWAQEITQEIVGGTFGVNANYSIGIASNRKIEGDTVNPSGPRFAVSYAVMPELHLEASGALFSIERNSLIEVIVGGHYNFVTGTSFTPYIGIGGGVSVGRTLAFTYQGTGGIVVEILDWVGLVASYRLTGSLSGFSHNIDVGLLFPF